MEEDKPVKIEKWDQNAVRIAMDDAAKKAVLGKGYEENFHLVDSRLMICTIAILFALFALLWDYLHPFPASKTVLIICVASYFLLMGVLTLHANFKEKNIFLVAHQKDPVGTEPDIVWTVASSMLKYDKNYTITITVTNNNETKSASITKCVGEVFDENGVLLYDKYAPMILGLHDSIDGSKKKK
ncbi:signal peptidase complex subunit 2-like [Ciona intestinalis]|uniref:Signal peptidase complex subunit 2 n=1 Tax=Ciona intestinalis TaxID=7719 RepID=F6QFI4_CIOIN|nr:probable signal peptidase complex subunit 2 [Ciona intestinalis]|eukprot:XP_002126209.3 probable signal peptidase complex subunit 2 [Ciona intestinalis]